MTLEIVSPQNPRIKEVVRLRDRRGRQKQSRFIIDGLREIQRACASTLTIEEVYFDISQCQQEAERATLSILQNNGVKLIEVSGRVMEKLSYGQRQLGMVAVASTPALRTLSDFFLTPEAFIIVLEAVEKPGNLGAIMRTADAAGVDAVFLSGGTDDLFNPNTIRSSSGSIYDVSIDG